MGVHIEPIMFVIRAGPELSEYGKPFDFVATGITVDHETVRIIAAHGNLPIREAAQLRKQLRELGFKKVVWERKKSDSEYKHQGSLGDD